MAVTISGLRRTVPAVTVSAFRRLPEDRGPVYHELRHGEVVPVTRPKFRHTLIQRTLRRLLEDLAHPASFVDVEVPFRPLPEYELWTADVAYLSPVRFAGVDADDNIPGSPDLVIEVLSPSNSAEEMAERQRICLENGSKEFWPVDPKRRQVKISTPEGHSTVWNAGQLIPMPLFQDALLPVDAIFSSLA